MATEKQDYMEKCNQAQIPVVTHMQKKCKTCKKADCVRAEKAPK